MSSCVCSVVVTVYSDIVTVICLLHCVAGAQMNVDWERVACGQTDAQVELIRQAHEFLNATQHARRLSTSARH